jgi:DHA2 family lincomycin resistance protein-like MFS transporter
VEPGTGPERPASLEGSDDTAASDALETTADSDALEGRADSDALETTVMRLESGAGAGAEGGVIVPWPVLLRHRAHHRVRSSDRYQWWVLWTVLAGLLSVNITFTVFVVALPQVARELHTSVSTLTWTSTGPLLAFGVAAPVLGKIGDVWGLRRLYLWGLVGAAVCVVLTASAPTAGLLITARVLDGIEGAATGAASMALILQVFSAEDRVKAMGWWALVGAGGPVIGVTVGAPIIQYLGWRALFWGELPLMAVAMVLALVVLPGHTMQHTGERLEEGEQADGSVPEGGGHEADGLVREGGGLVHEGTVPGEPSPVGAEPTSPTGSPSGSSRPVVRRPSLRRLDWTGSGLLSLGVVAGLLALNQAPAWGWTAPATLVMAALCVVGLLAFVAHERRTPEPLIPLRYFMIRNFTFPLGARALTNFSYMGGFFLFPILMERVYGYSETRAGLESTARPLLFSIVAPLAGYAAVRVGERLSAVVGALILAASMLLFTQLGQQPSLVLILAALSLSGVGIGIVTPSTAASASNEVRPEELGVMSAAQQLVTQIGVVAGIQVMETVQASSHSTAGALGSFHRAFLVGAVVAVLAAVCALFMRDTERPSRVVVRAKSAP